MNVKTMVETLQSIKFTQGMKQEHLEKLAVLASEVTFAEGQTIFNEGDLEGLLYLIKAGQVILEMHLPGRGRVAIQTVGPGQLLGWSALFPHRRKTASSRAVTATTAIAISTPQLLETFQHDCDFAYAVTWRVAEVMADRLKATRLHLMDIFAPSNQG